MISVEKEAVDFNIISDKNENSVIVKESVAVLSDSKGGMETKDMLDNVTAISNNSNNGEIVDEDLTISAKTEKKRSGTRKAKNGKKAKPSEKVMTTAKNVSELSMSLEDYLEKIYLLSLEFEEVRVTDIADSLNLSKPSVNRAVNNLTSLGYITHAHYGSIELTDSGFSTAKAIYKKHKVIKQFLMQCLGIDKVTAENEAYNLKHFISKSTCKRLKNFLADY